MTDEIKALGYDEETAGNYAALIGDTPCMDEAGNIVVIDCDYKLVAPGADGTLP